MSERRGSLLRKAFTEALPYIHNIKWLSNLVSRLSERDVDIEAVRRRLAELLSTLDDETKRTDIRILMIYLDMYMRRAMEGEGNG